MLEKEIQAIFPKFEEELSQIHSTKDLEDLRIKYIGKKGLVPSLMMKLKNLSREEKPKFGKIINELKEKILESLEEKAKVLEERELLLSLSKEKIDCTLPGRKNDTGRHHPIMQIMDRMIEIFESMGFSVQLGPDLDSDYYNFEALNFPLDHPARDMQDTFYVTEDLLLRTHTSNTQVRVMEANRPPIRVICPGRCFRNETISARSHVFFHQVEGFYIDKNVSFSDLLYTLDDFWKKLLGSDVQTRFRPSYFPFVEPGIEVDISCSICKGKGCSICKKTGWLEVCGAGMIHPNVLSFGNIDPDEYSGYAWGIGVERLAMLLYGMSDIRLFTQNDKRFLDQF